MITILNQELAKYGLQAKFGPQPIFVDKVLLEHSLRHSFTYYLWLLCAAASEPSGYKRDHMT